MNAQFVLFPSSVNLIYEEHLFNILSGAPFNKRSLTFLYPVTTVLMVFLYEVKSSLAISLIVSDFYFSYAKTDPTSLGFPISFSANTFKDASVGSPTLLNVLFF